MPTEAGKTKARQAAWGLMTMRNWTIGDLASHAGADPATVGDFLAGKRWPRVGTLGKIEDALEMTRGTLAALGEEQSIPGESPSPASTLGAATDSELTSELTYRIEKLRREVAEMRRRIEADREAVERERRRQERRVDFLGSINEDSAEDLQQIAHEWMTLAYESQEGAGSWKADHQSAWEALCDTIDALVWAEDNDLAVVERLASPDEGLGGLPDGDFLGLTDRERHPGGVVHLPQWFWLELIRRNERPYTGPRPGEDPWQYADPTPSGADKVTKLTPKHQRMIEEAQQIDRAAYDGEGQGEE